MNLVFFFLYTLVIVAVIRQASVYCLWLWKCFVVGLSPISVLLWLKCVGHGLPLLKRWLVHHSELNLHHCRLSEL